MRRTTIHYLTDLGLFLTLLGMVLTGLLLALVLPPGSGGSHVWGVTRHEWGDVHWWIAIAMLGFVVIHVMLNWTWVCTVSVRLINPRHQQPSNRPRHLAGIAVVVCLLAIIATFLLVTAGSVVEVEHEGGGGSGGGHGRAATQVERQPEGQGGGRGGGQGRGRGSGP